MAGSRAEGGEELGFDEVISRLRAVLERLEQGNLSLEDSLNAYEEGVGLARRGHVLLDAAEKRVEVLVKGAGGEPTAVPLDGEAAPANGARAGEREGNDDTR